MYQTGVSAFHYEHRVPQDGQTWRKVMSLHPTSWESLRSQVPEFKDVTTINFMLSAALETQLQEMK